MEQLRALPAQGCDRLILLGDVFQAWIGARRFETDDIRAVMAALHDLRAGGLRIDYIEGNRDFFLKDSVYSGVFDGVVLETSFTVDGVRYLAVHGDGLNDRDWKYRFWRWLSKSRPVRFLVLRIPERLAHRLVHGTEQRLSQTNFKHRAALPEEAIRRYAERRLAEGYDVLLLGHFHEPRTWTVRGGEVRLLDAWFRGRQMEWIGPGQERIGPG